jgi:ribosomal protein S12 methylthiotransferase accessory factor
VSDNLEQVAERPLPIVFVGPSIPLSEARRLIDADFRPPCRRGDFAAIPSGSLVGIIDGVFQAFEAVSPRELVHALERGVRILGSSSMGALRAVEVPGILGVGRVFEMYRDGVVEDDDEVALLFDAATLAPLTVPLINVRYAVERLVRSATLDRFLGNRIVETARGLHYTERTYAETLRRAGLADRVDGQDLLHLLASIDLKKQDAILLLETLREWSQSQCDARLFEITTGEESDYGRRDDLGKGHFLRHTVLEAPVLVWETGDRVSFRELIRFLKMAGRFEEYARAALLRLLAAGARRRGTAAPPPMAGVKTDFIGLCQAWGWNCEEEVRATLVDLGVGLKDALSALRTRAIEGAVIENLARAPDREFLNALRSEMMIDDLAIKREVIRCGSVRAFSGRRRCPEAAARAVQGTLCRIHNTPQWNEVVQRLSCLGVSSRQTAAFVRRLADARTLFLQDGRRKRRLNRGLDETFGITKATHPPGDPRFSVSISEAMQYASSLRRVIGVTRLGMIGGLGDLEGVHVSQVCRPEGAWSSTYGSGKAMSRDGAVVAGIMEETEKWAQERFCGDPVLRSYAENRGRATLNPRLLDLPYDSRYSPRLQIAWHSTADLLQGRRISVPLAALACPFNAGANNIYYSARAARVVFSTNGLASGFSTAEALLHATCEVIERHATRLADLRVDNPGIHDRSLWPKRIVLSTLGERSGHLIESVERAGCSASVWNITSEVRVPTCAARIKREGRWWMGWAAHPNPDVAAHMALLEACQSVLVAIAAGREDLVVQARSLGRHERSHPIRAEAQMFWDSPSAPTCSAAEMGGIITKDIATEFAWVRERLLDAGVEHLLAVSLSREEISPARVARVVVPGLETTNPFYCGPRARLALLSDFLVN